MKKLLLLSIFITILTGTARAMDADLRAALEDKARNDAAQSLAMNPDNIRTLYASKEAESTEYKRLFLKHLFMIQACVPDSLQFLDELHQEIDRIDPEQNEIIFNNNLLANIVLYQMGDPNSQYRIPLLQWCIDRGAPIDGGQYHTCPLAVAINIAHKDVVALLLECGADVHKVVDGQTLLSFAHSTWRQVRTFPQTREEIKDMVVDHALSGDALYTIQDKLKGNNILLFVQSMIQYKDIDEAFVITRLLSFCASHKGMAQEIQLLIDRTKTNNKILNNEECVETTTTTSATIEKLHSLSPFKKFGIAALATFLTCLALHKLHAWLYLHEDDEGEEETDMQDTTLDAITDTLA